MSSLLEILSFAFVIFTAIGFHEYAHCKVAELMGDPTPREMGRVTLNLFKHFDPLGTVMIVMTAIAGIGIGWGKPAPANPNRMKNPRWGFFTSVIAGPACNILQALVWAIVLRLMLLVTHIHGLNLANVSQLNGIAANLCVMGVLINIRLALFNLIPLGPLDGHWLVGLLLPKTAMTKWFQFNRQWGGYLLIAVILISQVGGRSGAPTVLSLILGPPVDFLFRLFTGTK